MSDAEANLTAKRRVFVEEYLKCWNGTEAARRAEYAYPGREAYRLLKIAEIQDAIKRRIKAKAMDANEVLAHLGDIARFDVGRLLGPAGVVDWDTAKERGDTRYVKKIEWTDGKLKVEFYDRIEALELIGKNLAMWTEKHEHSGRVEVSYPAVMFNAPQDALGDS